MITIFSLNTSLNSARAMWTTKLPRPKFQKAAKSCGDFMKHTFDLNIFEKLSGRGSKIPIFLETT